MATKSALSGVEIKSETRGEVEAVFSTFNVIDKDGDVTFPGAFTDGEEIAISGYGHSIWKGDMPVGTGRIRTTRTEAILQGQFFMNTTAGRDTFEVVKAMGPRQQWSYGFDVLHVPETGMFQGRKANFLKKLKVHEGSPVFQGAGINTRTLSAKSLVDSGVSPEEAQRLVERNPVVTDYLAAIRPHESPVTRKAWDFAGAVKAIGDDVTIDDLRAMYAYVNPLGDPGVKSSYDYLHHHGPGGPANLRACFSGIGRLIKGDHGLSEAESQAVYDHLAAHLDDGDIEPPEMRSESGIVKQNAELAVLLADWQTARARLWETKRTRALKGKALGATTVMVLEWISDDQRETKALLDSPQEEADREFARYIQSLLNVSGA